jgi:hypothetical protein
MDAPFNRAIEMANSILAGVCVFVSTESTQQALILIRDQVNRLQTKPGDPIPLGFTERQRYEYLVLLLNAAATAQRKIAPTENQ